MLTRYVRMGVAVIYQLFQVFFSPPLTYIQAFIFTVSYVLFSFYSLAHSSVMVVEFSSFGVYAGT